MLALAFCNEHSKQHQSVHKILAPLLEDVTSRLCTDCFGRNLLMMFNCLGEKDINERIFIIRADCPAAPKFFKRYMRRIGNLG